MSTRKTIAVGVVVSFYHCACLAHGLHHTVLEGGKGVEARYDSEQPMAYCEAKVFSPTNTKTEFQEGLTDGNGRFMFYPDATGVWHITVDDGMGHMLKAEIPVHDGMQSSAAAAPRMSHPHAAVLGVSLIFGLFGFYSLFFSRRTRTRKG